MVTERNEDRNGGPGPDDARDGPFAGRVDARQEQPEESVLGTSPLPPPDLGEDAPRRDGGKPGAEG